MMPFTAAKLGAVQASVIVVKGLQVAGLSRVGATTCADASLAGLKQFNQFVLGIEGSVDGTSLSNTAVAVFPVAFGGSTLTAHTSADVQGSIRGKAGIAWDRVMIYGTGGVAFGGFSTNLTLAAPNFIPPFFATADTSNTRTGWTAGGGLQFAVTNNWWIYGEYRFSDFGTIRNGAFPNVPAGVFFNGSRRLQDNQVQAGFSYKFDTYAPAPLISKY
jgi:outer membrane immunogenic protein